MPETAEQLRCTQRESFWCGPAPARRCANAFRSAVVAWAVFLLTHGAVRAATGASPINEALATSLIYVSPTGSDANSGASATAPFKTIKHALSVALTRKKASTGVKVILAPGTYRQEGTAADAVTIFANMSPTEATSAPLIVEGAGWNRASPANTGDVIFSGSEDWSGGWTDNGNGTWTKPWPYAFGLFAKSTFDGVPANYGLADAILRRELVHVNGQTYYQINPPGYTNTNSVNDRVGPSYFNFPANDFSTAGNINGGRVPASEGSFWVTDAVLNSSGAVVTQGSITIKPPAGTNLNAAGTLVEVTTRNALLQFNNGPTPSPLPTNIILRNLTFQHAGRYALYSDGQDNLLIEDCRFIKNRRQGFNFGGGRNITLRRVEASGNGVQGAGFANVTNAVFSECRLNENARLAEILGYVDWNSCAIKLMFCIDVTFYRSEARNNLAAGFWWDTGCVDCALIESVATGNSEVGLYLENNNGIGNNYSSSAASGIGSEGIVGLGGRPTVMILRSVVAHNQAPPGTAPYHSTITGRGIELKENENAVIEGTLIIGNSIQFSTNDASRGELRNVTIQGSLVATKDQTQRLFSYSNRGSSALTIAARNAAGATVATLKGAWFALFDGLSGTTNDNRYFFPSAQAFPARSQREGTNVFPAPTLTLDAWRAAHLTNPNNLFADRSVDSRSTLTVGAYDETKPLVAIHANADALSPLASAAFTVTRVSVLGYDRPLTVNYTVRSNPGDAVTGTDFATLTGTLTIPAGGRSADIPVLSRATSARPLTISLVDAPASYVTGGNGSATVVLLPRSSADPRLSNLSVRTTLSANQVLIVGLTLQGGAKPVLVRAAGPSLDAFGVGNAMRNPRLTLYEGANAQAANDDWTGDPTVGATAAAVGAFPFAAATSLDAALVRTLEGGRTVHVAGPAPGNVLVEAYDAGPGSASRFVNVSARNLVGIGADRLIAGFTLTGGGRKTLLIRAAGPSLSALGVTAVLADPTIELFDSAQTKIGENDDFAPAHRAVFNAVGAFDFTPGARDSALLVSLPAGGYTVQVSGKGGATGIALVEIYEVP
jgi:hypothetical protein